jgi:hypothetical protein
MLKSVLIDSWPLAAALLLTCGALATVARFFRAGPRRPLVTLHADQQGGVQSLSFVLTAPLFIMLMMLAVQITQLMIGLVIVHYAAFAAARSASVWYPAYVENDPLRDGENRMGQRVFERMTPDGTLYRIQPTPGPSKFEQVRRAAALACVPIAPSRSVPVNNAQQGSGNMATAIQNSFAAYAPATYAANPKIKDRLANKWAYANAATDIDVRVLHYDWPPLWHLGDWPTGHYDEYEIGWTDQIRVTVTHQFALLPGPGRLLARQANQSRYRDTVSPQIKAVSNIYTIPLSATASMVGEGEQSRIRKTYVLSN